MERILRTARERRRARPRVDQRRGHRDRRHRRAGRGRRPAARGLPGRGQGPARSSSPTSWSAGSSASRTRSSRSAARASAGGTSPSSPGPARWRAREQLMEAATAAKAGRRDHAARRGLQAAHVAVRLPGPGSGGAGDPGRGAGADRSAHRHRTHGSASSGAGGQVLRHHPDRRPQHAELPAAVGGGRGRPAGAAQARAWPPPSTSCSWRRSTSSRRATTR